MKFLFDSSALYPALEKFGDRLYGIAKESAILDLTKYEIGNAVLKESKVKGVDWNRATNAWQRLLRFFNVIAVDNLVEVQKIAVENGLTFYDASYVHAAEEHGLKLVTEDTDLLRSSKNAIDLGGIDETKR